MLPSMSIWGIALIVSSLLAATGFVVVAVLWLRKMRDALATTLGETAGTQFRTVQRLTQTIDQLLHRQELYEKRLCTLTEANIKMRQDLNVLAARVALSEGDAAQPPQGRVLH